MGRLDFVISTQSLSLNTSSPTPPNPGATPKSFNAANRLTSSVRNGGVTVAPIYNGVNDRVAQVTDGVTTTFALDVAGGLPEVIYTSDNEVFLHLPGVIVAKSSTGETRYLLSDGLGSVRHAVDESAQVVAYNEFDPYGNPIQHGSEPYGYTGEWWGSYIELLHLRARWYSPDTGTFLSVDPVGSEPPYQYVRGNVVNFTDPSGKYPGPIDGYVEGVTLSVALPLVPGMEIPALPIDGTSATISATFYNIIEKAAQVASVCFFEGLPKGNRWGRKHYVLAARELVYDFAHMQSGDFAPEPVASGGVDVATNLGAEIYVSVYAGPIIGLAGHDSIRGYAKNATNSLGLGLSTPSPTYAGNMTVGLGASLNTNSAAQPNTAEAFGNLFKDSFDPDKNIEVTSLVFGGSIGGSTQSNLSPSGKVRGSGNVGWATNTALTREPTNYIKQPSLRVEPTSGEMRSMASDITTGIRYQTVWDEVVGKGNWKLLFVPSVSNLYYGSPIGVMSPIPAGTRLNAVSNLYSYWR